MRLNENNRDSNLEPADTKSARVLSKNLTDVDMFSEFLPYRQYKIVQLSCGALECEFLTIASSPATV